MNSQTVKCPNYGIEGQVGETYFKGNMTKNLLLFKIPHYLPTS